MNFGGINNIPTVVNVPNGIREYNISYSFLCYSNTTNLIFPYSHDLQVDLKMQESLQAFGQIIYFGKSFFQQLLFAYIKTDQLLMTYPCLRRYDINSYFPEERNWYIESIKNYNSQIPYENYNYSITDPYSHFNSTSIALALALPIVDQTLRQIGTVSLTMPIEALFDDVSSQFGKDLHAIYLIQNDGILIMHPYNVTANQIPLYIFNESVTGFSKNAWQILNSKDSSSNCSYFAYDVSFKCIYNSYYNQLVFAGTTKLEHLKISILIIMSSSVFNDFQQEYNDSLLVNLNEQLLIQVVTQISALIVCSFVIFIVTNQLFYPLELIIQMAMSQISNKVISRIQTIQLQLAPPQIFFNFYIKRLYESCSHFNKLLETFSFNKTENCQLFENFKFPLHIHKNINHQKILVNYISDTRITLKLKNNQGDQFQNSLQIIRYALGKQN